MTFASIGSHWLFRAAACATLPAVCAAHVAAAPITNTFSGYLDLSYFGGTGNDLIELTYTFDPDDPPLSQTVGRGSYGPLTGQFRADSVGPGGFVFDFTTATTDLSQIVMFDNGFGPTVVVDSYGVIFTAKDPFSMGSDLLRGFAFSFVDTDGTVYVGDSENHRVRMVTR